MSVLVMEEVENLNEIDLSTVQACFKTCDEIGPLYVVVTASDELKSETLYVSGQCKEIKTVEMCGRLSP